MKLEEKYFLNILIIALIGELLFTGLTEYQYNEGQLPSNPFLEKSKSKADLLEIASEVLSTITSRRSFSKFRAI